MTRLNSTPVKVLVGLATVWMTFYPLLFLIVWFGGMVGLGSSMDSRTSSFFFTLLPAIFPLHCLTILLSPFLMGFYIFHIAQSRAISDAIRILAAIGVVSAPFIAMPLYYLLFVLRSQPPGWALAPTRAPVSPHPDEIKLLQ